MASEIIVYSFSRANIVRRNFEPFLRWYALHKLPVGRALKARLGSLIFYLEDYDCDRWQVHANAEVRRFFAAFHRRWPYWLYFCDLGQDDLKLMVYCCLDSFAAIQVDGQANAAIAYDRQELDRFLEADRAPLLELCAWAGLRQREASQRLDQVRAYFQERFRPTGKNVMNPTDRRCNPNSFAL